MTAVSCGICESFGVTLTDMFIYIRWTVSNNFHLLLLCTLIYTRTFLYSSFLSVMMATCSHSYSCRTVPMMAMLALSDEMVRRNVGKRPLSESVMELAV